MTPEQVSTETARFLVRTLMVALWVGYAVAFTLWPLLIGAK